MPLIQGTSVATFDNEVPVTLQGEWNIDTEIPTFRGYGQGDGTPGSGYIGAAKGTGQRVSGAFNFVVDKGGEETRAVLQRGYLGFFTIDWPIGDPALNSTNGRAIDATFDSLSFKVNNPEGSFIISGRMSAGMVTGPIFDSATS
ncbi:MAG: hypothetical protein E6Q97_36330 [Desulfurellales bacterium]|nr:MAG: hypothetical protein E6Q97_36330 [Desulfurellales bacterium]